MSRGGESFSGFEATVSRVHHVTREQKLNRGEDPVSFISYRFKLLENFVFFFFLMDVIARRVCIRAARIEKQVCGTLKRFHRVDKV